MQTIQENDLEPSDIKLEITEHILIENFEETKALMESLNHQGVEFIIDDFGTGYSSLSYLKNLPFSALKIDQTFIRDMLNDPDDAALIKAIISIAQQFNYKIVAEGVEEKAQLQRLQSYDSALCFQGFLICEPCSAEKFEHFLSKQMASLSNKDHA